MPTERLFVSIAFPPSVREELSTLYEQLPGIAWTRPEQLHLTLRFLGDVESSVGECLRQALGRIQVESFLMPVGGLGAFPPRGNPRVLWIGAGSGHPRLHQLRQRVDDALLGAGAVLDARLFQPHATLARVHSEASPDAVAQFIRRHQGFEAAPFRVDAFQLCASELRPAGAIHTVKCEYALRRPG